MATVKNVGLSPLNIGDVKKYTAMQSPSYREDFYQKMLATNDVDYYLYTLNEADKKGLKLEDYNFTDLDDIDDQWAAFYMEAAADNGTKKDYGQGLAGDDEEPWGELTEKEYLSKVLDKKREYNVWMKEEAAARAQKEAMSGWDKFWNGVGAWFTELGYSLEQIPLSILDLVTNWDGGESVGFIEDWRQDTLRRQQELADWERKYTDLRDFDSGNPTFMGSLALGSSQTLGLMIPSMLANMVVPGSGMYVMYGTMFAENVYEARHNENVNATWYEILLRSALMTGAELAVELALGSSLLDDVVLNGRKFTAQLGKVTTLEGIKILGKDILHEACEEALQELASGMANMVMSLANPAWEQENSDNLIRDMAMAALMGGIFAAGNITFGVLANDIKSGRILRNITRKFEAGDIIADYNVKTKTKTDTDTKAEPGYHTTNIFERIALNATFSDYMDNMKIAEKLAKKGKLSQDQRQLLYNQTMALGTIFNGADTSQIQRAMNLLDQFHDYAKTQQAKQSTLRMLNEAYLDTLMVGVKSSQAEAVTKYFDKKISAKDAAKLAKEAKITKTSGVITKENVQQTMDALEARTTDTKKKARKKVVKTLVDEGKTIIRTDGEAIELTEDFVFVPDAYLDNGDPNYIVRSAIEKDMAQEFVVYMKSPKRLVGWTQAKAALVKAYPEMADYTDQQIARNLLFNPTGAATLVSVLPNSEFNILFLNMLDGLKQITYKTDVAKAVKEKTIKLITDNFRFAARTFCANNLGVNPHDLHNVLTKADQIYIKNERAKIEGKATEVARLSNKIYSKQSLEDLTEEEKIAKFHQDYKAAQNGDKPLELFSGTLERRGYLPEQFENFNNLYQAVEQAEPGQYITLPQDLWTTSDGETNQLIYGPGNGQEGDRTIQWRITIDEGAPDPTYFDGNQSYVFPGYQTSEKPTAILIESVESDGNGNLFVKGRIGGDGYYKEPIQSFTRADVDQEGASFTTPEYENETYKFMQENMLKPTLDTLEKSNLTLKEIIRNPESYLRPEIIEYILNNFDDLSPEAVYMGLRSYIIGETDGTKTITINEDGTRYYFADVTNVKKWNTTEFNEAANNDPSGTSLIEKYKGKTVNAREFWRGEALVGRAADVEIEFRDGGGTYYADEQNKIYVDTNSRIIKTNLELLFALNHEFQHALQSTNRTHRGFTTRLNIPADLVAEVKQEFPDKFKPGMTTKEEQQKANEIIYEFSGEKEANQHAIEEDYYPFIIAVKGDGYVVFTPNGAGPFKVPFGRTNFMDEEGNDKVNKVVYRGTSKHTFQGDHLMTYYSSSEDVAKVYSGKEGEVNRYNLKVDKKDIKYIDMGGYTWDFFNDEFFWFDDDGKIQFEEGFNPGKEFKKALTDFYKDLDKIKYEFGTDRPYAGNPPEVEKCCDTIAKLINDDEYHSVRAVPTTPQFVEKMRPLIEHLGLEVNQYSLLYAAYQIAFFECERLSTESILLRYKMTYPDLKVIVFENISDPGFGDHYVVFKDADSKTVVNRTEANKRVPKAIDIENSNLKFFKKKSKKLRMDEDLQNMVVKSDLNKLDEWVSTRIKDGTLTKRKLMKWFKEAPNINEYTFKMMRETFWPNSPILTFEDLTRTALSLTFDIDKRGNYKEVKFRYNGQEFTISEDNYKVAIMEHYSGPEDLKKIRKIVGATEILRRTKTFTELETKAKNNTGDDDFELVLGATEDFTEAVLNDTPRARKAQTLRELIVKKVAAKAMAGEWDYNKSKATLDKYTAEYFEDLPDEQLDALYLKETMKKANIKSNDEIIKKALTRNRKNAVANIKRLASTIWNNTTVKNRKRLPKEVQEMFDEKGNLKSEVYKGKETAKVAQIEEQLKEIALKARRGDYASDETQKAYASLEKMKKKVETMKNKAKTNVKSTTKVVTEYETKIKTEAKVIQVQTTKSKVPEKLEKLLSTNFTKKRMSNLQELDNFEYYVSEKEVFSKENQELLDSITEAEWIEIIEWFEQSEFVGTESEVGTWKAIRMFILADLVSKVKTHQVVLDNAYVNRANNIMTSKVHSSAVEMATWSHILNTINPYRKLAEEYNISEETVDDIQAALESDDDQKLAEAIDQLKTEIAENYVEKSLMEKVMAFRYTAMLSGPTTWLRNLISNFIVKHFNKWSAAIGTKLGGKRLEKYQGYKITGTKVRADVAEFIKINLLDTGLLHQLTEGYSKYDPYTAEKANKVDKDYIVRTMVNNFNKKFEQDRAYGTGKVANVFNKFSAFVRKMISDDKFVNEATLRYFGKMLTEDIEAGRLDPITLKEGIFNKEIVSKFAEAQWLAMGDYMKNTNFMTKAMSALNESKWARYIMPLIIPFAQSSWNWWVETMRYSPFGLAQSIVRLLRYEKYVNDMDAKRNSSVKGQSASVQGAMLDKYLTLRNVGKGVIGTSLWALGTILASTGLVGVSKNDDDKYVIKMFGVELNIENYFGSSTFLAGAALVGAIKEGDWGRMFNVTIDQMAKTLFVTDLLSTFRYESIGDYVLELPMNILYSFVPNFIKTISTNLQIYKVKYDKGILGDLERFASGLIPGLAYAFPQEIDPYTGKRRLYRLPVLTQALGISYNDLSEAERAAIAVGVGAGQLTGELTVDGQKYQLDREKVNVYRGQYVNQYMTDLLEDNYLYENKRYSQMDKATRKKAIQSILDKCSTYAKIRMWTEMGNKYYASKELYYTLKNLGINNVYQGSGGYIKK